MNKIKKGIITFLLTEAILISIFSTLIILDGRGLSENVFYAVCLMFSPAVSSLIINFIYHKNLRGFGWKFTNFKYLFTGYFIPVLYIMVFYGIALLFGLIQFDSMEIAKIGVVEILQMFFVNIILLCIIVLGEEIGWRGYLLPKLCRVMSFGKASFIVGIVWACVHLPIFIFSDYNTGSTPLLLRIACFLIILFGANIAINWLRIKSNSLWPAVLFHASHNSFLQDVNPLFVKTEISEYVVSESGIALAVAGIVIGIIFWFKSKELGKTST